MLVRGYVVYNENSMRGAQRKNILVNMILSCLGMDYTMHTVRVSNPRMLSAPV